MRFARGLGVFVVVGVASVPAPSRGDVLAPPQEAGMPDADAGVDEADAGELVGLQPTAFDTNLGCAHASTSSRAAGVVIVLVIAAAIALRRVTR